MRQEWISTAEAEPFIGPLLERRNGTGPLERPGGRSRCSSSLKWRPPESQSKPGTKMVDPEPCTELRRPPQLFRLGSFLTNHGKPVFVGIYTEIESFHGFLRGGKWISQPSTVARSTPLNGGCIRVITEVTNNLPGSHQLKHGT